MNAALQQNSSLHPSDAPPVIEMEGLTKRFGAVVAVDSLTLAIPRGGVFGLLGPNGSGKTTTMGMLLGLLQPTSGTIRLFGDGTPGVHAAVLRRIGAIVETPAFYPYLSGRANLRYFRGIGRRGSQYEVDRLLELVDLVAAADRPFRTYSLGMKQRLGIAFALLGNPEVVFLDEPTNGLDPAGVAEVRTLIRSLGEEGRTVILSSHLLSEVQQVADRVAILSRGKLVVQGAVADLLRVGGALRLRTTDDARAAWILSGVQAVEKAERRDGAIELTIAPERAWEASRALAGHGIYVAEMAPVQASLERYFLEVTDDVAR
jgi:ABC-2 type transport system ATP-binding protein